MDDDNNIIRITIMIISNSILQLKTYNKNFANGGLLASFLSLFFILFSDTQLLALAVTRQVVPPHSTHPFPVSVIDPKTDRYRKNRAGAR
jgi:hypothetical protein